MFVSFWAQKGGLIPRRLLPLFLLVSSIVAWGQTTYRQRFGSRDGLVQYTVSLIAQDAQGFMWFGTESGASRFDGVEFQNYSLQNGFSNAPVQALIPRSGIAYALSLGKLYLLEGESAQFIPLPDYAYSAFELEGEIWLLYEGRIADLPGRHSFRCPSHTAFTKEGIPPVLSQAGRFTFALGRELFQFDPNRGIQTLGQLPAAVKELLPGSRSGLRVVLQDRLAFLDTNGSLQTLWLAPKGIVLSHGASMGGEVVYLTTSVGGVIELEKGQARHHQTRLDQHDVRAAFVDREQNLWLGFDSGGVLLLPKVRFTSFTPEDGLGSGDCFFVLPDVHRGGVWVGMRNGGVAHIGATHKVTPYRAGTGDLVSDKVRGLAINREGIVFVGTTEGIMRIDLSGRTALLPFSRNQNFRGLHQDSKGFMLAGSLEGRLFRWKDGSQGAQEIARLPISTQIRLLTEFQGQIYIGAQQGLYMWDGSHLRECPEFKGQKIQSLFPDEKGTLLVFTEGKGAWRLGPQGWEQFFQPAQVEGIILGAVLSPQGTLFIGSDSGLYLVDPKGVRRLDRKAGLNSEIIYLVGFDQLGQAWVGSNQGLNVVADGKVVASYDYRDGLADNETNGFGFTLDSQGRAWFCTMNGISTLDPAQVLHYVQHPYLSIRRLDINEMPMERLPVGDHLELPFELSNQQNTLKFHFSGIHHANPGGVRYQYRLEGFDRGWSASTTERYATYPQLPPGDYRFVVKCTNVDGIESPMASLKLRIHPAIWQQLWFRALGALLLVGLVAGLFLIRIRAVEQQNAQLEALVQLRTKDLKIAMAGLQEAKDAAERASGFKSAFIANTSHELRTPLNAILGFLQVLEQPGMTDAERSKFLAIIHHAARALLQVVNDLLDLSRIEVGALKIEAIPFHLPEVMEASIDLVSSQASAKDLKLAWEVDPQIPSGLLGDPHRLRQMLVNLLGNAVKFTRQGQVTAKATLLPDGQVKIQVDDTGNGVPPEVLPRLFEAFSQAEGEARKLGTGLGLSITRNLAHLMGGKTGVESALGVGSSFWFTFKAEPCPWEPPAQPQEVKPSPPPPEALRGRVLLADDNPSNRLLVGSLLTQMNLPHTMVADGTEALEVLETESFDLIILDGHMPLLGGKDTLKAIRTHPRWKHLPVLLFSNSNSAENLQTKEFDDFIAKPLVIEDFQAKISKYLHAASPRTVPSPRLVGLAQVLGGEDALIEFAQEFCDDALRRLVHLKEAIHREDRLRIEHIAHDLKTNAGNLEQKELSEAAAQMEQMAQTSLKIDLDAQWTQLERTTHTAISNLRAILNLG
jgi:signal transduction histidine kinase/ligand-binding sensor domain-containing protein/DNA-binding response OmpR family regulator